MADPSQLPREEVERARDLGGTTYCAAYIELMIRELGINSASREGFNEMVIEMVAPLNIATEAVWRALMHDHLGKEEALIRFRKALLEI